MPGVSTYSAVQICGATSRPRLYRLAYAWCHDTHLADDLVQEALAKAISTTSLLKEPRALECWLMSILNNCWRDVLRARKPHDDIDQWNESLESPLPDLDEQYAEQQLSFQVRRAIGMLPLAQRQVLTLVDIEECSYAEVATILGVPAGTVMSRLSRARFTLKESLQAMRPGIAAPRLRRVK
jgi:RNA polymerase sigma-70 factor (ECF subfamily)